MPKCYLCGDTKETIRKKIFDSDIRQTLIVDLCAECSDYYDDGERNPNQEYN